MSKYGNNSSYGEFPTGNQSQGSGASLDNPQGIMPHNVRNTKPQFSRNNDFLSQPPNVGTSPSPVPPRRYNSQFAPAQQWTQGYSVSSRSQSNDQAQQPSILQQPWHHVQQHPSQFYSDNFSKQPLAPVPRTFQQPFVDSPRAPPGSGNSIPQHQEFAPSRSDWNHGFVHEGQDPDDNYREVAPAYLNQGRPPPPSRNKKHSYDDCNAAKKDRRPNDDRHFLVERRAGKPLVYTRKDVRTILSFREYSESKGYPIAPATALRLASEGYFSQTRYGEKWSDDQKYEDPAWAVEDGRHIAPRGGLAHPLALQRYDDLHAKENAEYEGSGGVPMKEEER